MVGVAGNSMGCKDIREIRDGGHIGVVRGREGNGGIRICGYSSCWGYEVWYL